MRRFSVILAPAEDGYTVYVPALPGLLTEGETVEEAIANAKEAIELYLANLVAQGEPIPNEIEAPILTVIDVAD